MSQILPGDEITEDINSLNSKKQEVFKVVHTWDKDYVKYDGHNVEPGHKILISREGRAKFRSGESNI